MTHYHFRCTCICSQLEVGDSIWFRDPASGEDVKGEVTEVSEGRTVVRTTHRNALVPISRITDHKPGERKRRRPTVTEEVVEASKPFNFQTAIEDAMQDLKGETND
jgi:DNA-directed RNA polymerase subunit E'/Rpb7